MLDRKRPRITKGSYERAWGRMKGGNWSLRETRRVALLSERRTGVDHTQS